MKLQLLIEKLRELGPYANLDQAMAIEWLIVLCEGQQRKLEQVGRLCDQREFECFDSVPIAYLRKVMEHES